jgi:hypothetical protein
MYQQLWGYKVEEKLYLGVREQKGWIPLPYSARNGNSEVPAYFLEVKQGYTARQKEKDKCIYIMDTKHTTGKQIAGNSDRFLEIC